VYGNGDGDSSAAGRTGASRTHAPRSASASSTAFVIAAAPGVKGKLGENLRGALDTLPMCRVLATIKCDVEMKFAPQDLRRTPPDNARLRELFARLEFRTWLADLGGTNPAPRDITISAPLESGLFDSS